MSPATTTELGPLTDATPTRPAHRRRAAHHLVVRKRHATPSRRRRPGPSSARLRNATTGGRVLQGQHARHTRRRDLALGVPDDRGRLDARATATAAASDDHHREQRRLHHVDPVQRGASDAARRTSQRPTSRRAAPAPRRTRPAAPRTPGSCPAARPPCPPTANPGRGRRTPARPCGRPAGDDATPRAGRSPAHAARRAGRRSRRRRPPGARAWRGWWPASTRRPAGRRPRPARRDSRRLSGQPPRLGGAEQARVDWPLRCRSRPYPGRAARPGSSSRGLRARRSDTGGPSRRPASPRRLLEDDVRVGAADAERGHRRPARPSAPCGPRPGLGQQLAPRRRTSRPAGSARRRAASAAARRAASPAPS